MSHDIIPRILNDASINLPGSVDQVLKQQMFAVVDELCRQSSIWHELIPFDTVVDQRTYYLVPTQGQILRLESIANHDLTPVWATMVVPGDVVLKWAPSDEQELVANVVLTVSATDRDNEPIAPDWVYETYRPAITEGLMSRMMLQPAKPYTNDALGAYHARRFRNYMAQARSSANHMNLQNGQRWRYPHFAG